MAIAPTNKREADEMALKLFCPRPRKVADESLHVVTLGLRPKGKSRPKPTQKEAPGKRSTQYGAKVRGTIQ